MRLERDARSGASYIAFTDAAPVAHTISLSDLVWADLDTRDQCVGIELAMRPECITESTWELIVGYCPDLKEAFPDVSALRDGPAAIPA